ncbi:ABC transporter permease [Amycolatopsis rubida]|uniref:Autoinducer 2 import system permease protein LsrD n=1 Tax=Amycolatopsis rubida TaxID=112413 RepID=A0ABX0C177_9PSEU|nr:MULTISPECIES: ABC transporter permease [Amycolatopsis]MYW96098.1 ABC transporter permease [Amycolatopsis rubida]NEC61089.1 ABC transporter permease [Amycolatopsis rubida]OAP23391.1 Ribose transport system permease protein RbsC [Amycolatopsis sp. M39]
MAESSIPGAKHLPGSSLKSLDFLMVWVALAALAIVSGIFVPGTLAPSGLLAMLPFAAVLVIASIGQCLTIQSGGMDLSVPGSMTLAAAVVTGHADRQDGRIGSAVLLALGAVVLGGLLNGVAVTKLRIPPIVATLAVNALMLGFVQSYTGGVLQAVPPNLAALASAKTFGLPNTWYVAAVFVVIAAVAVNKTVWGRRLTAVGAQPESARAAGISVSRYVIGTYTAAGLCFGIAGILLAGYLQTPATTIADPYLFSTITAVIVGGTAFGGGRSRIVGTAVGAVFVSQLNVFLTATGAPSSITYLVQAAAIAIAVLLNSGGSLAEVRGYARRLVRPSHRAPTEA